LSFIPTLPSLEHGEIIPFRRLDVMRVEASVMQLVLSAMVRQTGADATAGQKDGLSRTARTVLLKFESFFTDLVRFARIINVYNGHH
jgi:hypothetical protein